MFNKKSLFFVFLLLFSTVGFAKELNEDKVFIEGGLSLDKNTIDKLSIKYKPYFSEILDQSYDNYRKEYKVKNPKKELEFKKSDLIKIISKLKKFYAIHFWVTTKGKIKLELKGINIIDLIEPFPKVLKEKEIKSVNDFKYIVLSGDNTKNYVYLASKKGITVITMGVKLNDIFSYKAPKNTKNLEEVLVLKGKTKNELYLAFSPDSFLNVLTNPAPLRNFKGGIFKSSFNKSKEWNNIQIIAFLDKVDSAVLSSKLNSLYKKYLPSVLVKLEAVKNTSIKEKSHMPKLVQEQFFNILKNSLKELKISNKDNYLEISLKTKGIDNESSQLINISLVLILPAIGIPAYKSYMKKAKEHEELKKAKYHEKMKEEKENKIKSK